MTVRWSSATAVGDTEWINAGVTLECEDGINRALVVLPVEKLEPIDVWYTAGNRDIVSKHAVVSDVDAPAHQIVAVADIYAGQAPGSHNAERVAESLAERVSDVGIVTGHVVSDYETNRETAETSTIAARIASIGMV